MPTISAPPARRARPSRRSSRRSCAAAWARTRPHRHRCVHCHRTPLTGEVVHIYARRPASASSASSAARCAARRPARSVLMHAPEHERSVRVHAPRRRVDAARPLRFAPVDPVTLHVNIDRPREEVFAYLADIANHPEFTDHFLKDWRLTREDSEGRGAGARYRQDGRFDRFGYYDLNFAEVEPPYRIVAVGRGGKYNRIKTYHEWTLEPERAAGRGSSTSTRPSRRCRPTASSRRSSGRRGWFRRNGGKALRRLRSILEENRDRGARATVGGSRLTRRDDPPRPPRAPLLAAAAALAAAGCGNKEEYVTRRPRPRASTSTVDDLKYQVQISRILNPARRRGPGLPARRCRRREDARPTTRSGSAIFMRVENDDGRAARDGRRSSRSRTRRTTSSSRSSSTRRSTSFAYEPQRAPAGRASPAARRAGVRQHDPGRRCCCSRSRRRAPQPPARARDRAARAAARTRSTSTSRAEPRLRIGAPRRLADAARGGPHPCARLPRRRALERDHTPSTGRTGHVALQRGLEHRAAPPARPSRRRRPGRRA